MSVVVNLIRKEPPRLAMVMALCGSERFGLLMGVRVRRPRIEVASRTRRATGGWGCSGAWRVVDGLLTAAIDDGVREPSVRLAIFAIGRSLGVDRRGRASREGTMDWCSRGRWRCRPSCPRWITARWAVLIMAGAMVAGTWWEVGTIP